MPWTFHIPPHDYTPHASQFAGGLTGACTLLALAACDVVSKGLGAWVGDPKAPHPQPDLPSNVQAVMLRIYHQARALGNCGPNGSATQNGMIRQARLISLPVRDTLPFQDADLPHDQVINFLHRHIAHADRPYPVLVQTAAGHLLRDNETGQADEPTLQVHAYALYGTQTMEHIPSAGGYVGADGDNDGANLHPQIYNLTTILAARPISLIAFNYA